MSTTKEQPVWTDADRKKQRYYQILSVGPRGGRKFVVGFYANLHEADKILDGEFNRENKNLELYHDKAIPENLCGAYEIHP